jgi:pilus assembly protein CpaC
MFIGSRSSVRRKSVSKSIRIVLPMILAFSTAAIADAQQPETPVPTGTPEQTLPPASAKGSEGASSAPLRVMVGKSLLINTSDRIKRISVTDPEVADPQVISQTQILIHGRSAGEVSLLIWDEFERSRSFDLRVDVDVSAATEEMNRVFPDERITVSPSRSAIVLSGHVSTEDAAKRAGMIAAAYSKNVVNVLTFGPVGAQEVLLEVKFAEVDRTAVTQLGVNLFAPGVGNTVLLSQTGQFGSVSVSNTGQSTTTAPDGTTTTTTTSTPPRVTVTDFLNFFVARQDVNVGAVIKALQQRNLLQILAEPNLIAVNGKEASFLAGGEFPFPVVQPSGGTTTVTIQFKQFGVQLKFTPLITPNGNIHLKVAPEVSTLDFANGVTVANSVVPALSTRRAETEFELQDGQSFVIAGLMDNRVTNLMNKIPGLGDIPILGNFFKSKNVQKSNAELMVLCTVHRVSASNQLPAGPTPPIPFLEKDKFDGTKAKPSSDKK